MNNEELVSEVLEDFERRRRERKPLELQWRLNMNFYQGNQYAEITAEGDIADYGKYYFWQQREVFNHIAPVMETRIAKLGRVKSGVSVRPFGSGDRDVANARLSTKILDAVTSGIDLKKRVNEAVYWSEICGSVFYKVEWNPNLGKTLGLRGKDALREGDIEVSVCPPYEIFPDSVTAGSLEACQSLIHARACPVKTVRELWGVDVEGEDLNVFSLENSAALGGLGYRASIRNVAYETRSDHCLVIEKYERPSNDFPDGRRIVIVGGQLLFDGPLPYLNGTQNSRMFPFVRQISLGHAAAFFGVSLIERLIPLQRSYNAVKNRKHEFLNRLAMGVLAVEDGSIDTEDLEEDGLSPGKVLVYRQGARPPEMLELGQIPKELSEEEDSLLNEFMIMSGISDLSRYGRVPANVTSGVALALLTEQDDVKISISAEYIREAVMAVSKQILRLYRQFADDAKIARIGGVDSETEQSGYHASGIEAENLVFNTENELTDTPESRKNLIMELYKMGLLTEEDGKTHPRAKVKILEMLGFGNWQSAADIEEAHRKKAMLENERLQLEFLEIDGHAIHIEEHTKALISEERIYDKQQKALLIQHIQNHKNQIEQEEKVSS